MSVYEHSSMKTLGDLKLTRHIFEDKEKQVHWKIPVENVFPTSPYMSPYFTFLDSRWFLSNDPPESGSKDCVQITLHLKRDVVEFSYDIECTFSASANRSLLALTTENHTFCEQKPKLVMHHFFSKECLKDKMPFHISFKSIVICCTLKLLNDSVKLAGLNLLSENIKGVFINGEFCDVVLNVKDTQYKAHKLILAARSPVFAGMFRHETLEKQTGMITISDCDPDSFKEFLEYIYCGKIGHFSCSKALHLYATADKYDVPELKRFCVECMKRNLNVENILDVIVLAEKYDDAILFSAAQEYFNINFGEIFVTPRWKDLLKKDCNLANKLLIEMSSNVTVVKKRKTCGECSECSEAESFNSQITA